jgi:hypothetical protein
MNRTIEVVAGTLLFVAAYALAWAAFEMMLGEPQEETAPLRHAQPSGTPSFINTPSYVDYYCSSCGVAAGETQDAQPAADATRTATE